MDFELAMSLPRLIRIEHVDELIPAFLYRYSLGEQLEGREVGLTSLMESRRRGHMITMFRVI